MEFSSIAAIAVSAFASTAIAITWLLRHAQRHSPEPAGNKPDTDKNVAFLFKDKTLHNASEAAGRLYQFIPGRDDWTEVRERLKNRFPSMPEEPEQAGPGEITIPARDAEDAAALSLTRDGDFTRIRMLEDADQSPAISERIKGLQQDLANLKRASDTTPHAVWQVDSQGSVIWYNTAYEALYERLHQAKPEAKKPVFDLLSEFDKARDHQRVATEESEDGQRDWYDISAVSVGGITIFHAMDINAVVKSEFAKRNFVQTLAKTFAQLSIGLAIFDRNGQLALFNPALIDLTNLPADFLSGRPTLMSFFDRIRENRRMPEPKNYQAWRQQIAEVIAAATDGRYQETWTLETGQTYRVIGRPHPDGAIAFLIEDISAEISLTRNFRAELELGQSLMDSFDEAIVVFSSTGVLTFCNSAYRDMWGVDPDNSFADMTIADCVGDWQRLCQPGPDWSKLNDFVMDFGEKTSWEMSSRMEEGDGLQCTISRITSGATIIRFSRAQVPVPALKGPETEDRAS